MHLCYYPIVAAAPATPAHTPVHVLLLLEPLQLLPLPPRLPPLPRLLSATIISSTRTRKENVRSFSLTLWFQWEFNRVLIPLLSNLYHQFNQFFIDIINAHLQVKQMLYNVHWKVRSPPSPPLPPRNPRCHINYNNASNCRENEMKVVVSNNYLSRK